MKEGHWKQAFERRITQCVEFKEGTMWVPPDVSSGPSKQPIPEFDEEVSYLTSYRAQRESERDEEDRCYLDRDSSPLTVESTMREHHNLVCFKAGTCDCAEKAKLIFNVNDV